jgi:biofilm PGA synthesis N-glycosyltransferase PgaC
VPDREDIARAQREFPVISVLIAAHNEELVIAKAIRRVLALDWPAIDLVVVDDGSTDGTREEVRPFVARGQARLLHKPKNEGKSMALNDGLRLCRGDLVLVLDADGQPAPDALANLAVHFLRPSVGAVTGNPRVLNTRNVLSRLQAIEFSATVGIQRRGDAVWGRLMTVSGLCVLLRRDVTASLGGFAPEMATEDIEMTWRLQLSGYEAMYEARALFGMEVPETLRTWWRQRCRWSLGLSQVLRRHALAALRPRNWRLWPVLIVGCLSIIWAHLVVLSVVLAIAWVALGHPLPELYGTLALFGGDHDHRRCRSGGHGIVDRSRQRPRHRPPAALGTLVSGVLLDSQRGNGAEENTARTDPASAWPFDVDSAP